MLTLPYNRKTILTDRHPWLTSDEISILDKHGSFKSSLHRFINYDIPRYNLDYSTVIDYSVKDLNIYHRKLWLWDLSKALGILNVNKVIRLLNDRTLYSYAFFDILHYWYQDMISSDDYRFIIFGSANQLGKSYLLNTRSVYNLLRDHGHQYNQAIISKSLPQAKYQMQRIKNMLRTAKFNWREEKGSTDNMMIISFNIMGFKPDDIKYTNYLICAPCTEGALGYDLHAIYLDEFDFWDVDQSHFFNQIAQPRTYHTKGDIIIFSNPNGRDRYLWELWNQKMPDGTYKWHRYKFNVWDKPGFTQHDYDIFSVGLTRYQIESTMLAIFSTSDRAYFSEDEIKRSYDPNLTELSMVGKQCFFFLDVGAKHDQSVLCGGYIEPDIDNPDLVHLYVPIIKAYPVGYPLSRVIGINVDSSDGWEYHKSVREYIDEWSVDGIIPVLGVDATGNSGIVPLMQSAKLNPEDVIFSGVVKSGMYQRFKYFLEKGLLHRIKHDLFDNQARTLVMKKSKRGYLMIHHESEDDLDDVMDSIAGLIHLSDNRSSTPNTIKII